MSLWELTIFVTIDWTTWYYFLKTNVIDLFRGLINDVKDAAINAAFVVVKLGMQCWRNLRDGLKQAGSYI